jgi:hypothetical protein
VRYPHDAWEGRYLRLVTPIVILGVILGLFGKDAPRITGLLLALVLLRVIGSAGAI